MGSLLCKQPGSSKPGILLPLYELVEKLVVLLGPSFTICWYKPSKTPKSVKVFRLTKHWHNEITDVLQRAVSRHAIFQLSDLLNDPLTLCNFCLSFYFFGAPSSKRRQGDADIMVSSIDGVYDSS